MDNAKEIKKYLKVLNPNGEILTTEQYKLFQNDYTAGNFETLPQFQYLCYLTACDVLAAKFIAENRNVEDFKDAAQETFLFVSTFKPKAQTANNFKNYLCFLVTKYLERLDEKNKRHNLHLLENWQCNLEEIADEEYEPHEERVKRAEVRKLILKRWAVLKKPKHKEYLLRYCGVFGAPEKFHEIAKDENQTPNYVLQNVVRTLRELRKDKEIQKLGRELND